ncbi:MAG: aminotransferase [Fibrobacteres bacterium]|nr:aminotransferase [Fibrobacterota bacterium]
MFSDRFESGPAEPNPQWEAKLSREASGGEVIDLTGSNPTVAGIPYPQGIPALFDRPSIMRYRPAPQGSPETRAAISAYYATRGRLVRPEDLILTASTSEAYSFLFKLLCNPGDEVLIPSPTYPLFDALAELEHVKLVRYPLRLTARWKADFGFLRSLVSTRSKALILVNPNNPTGHLTDAEEIRAYLELADEYGLALIVDEVFRDYLLGERPFLAVESSGPLVFTLNGLSKMLGLPQMKLGWIHVAGADSAVRAALDHLEWIADAFLSVNTPVQEAAGDLLKLDHSIQTAILARLRANLATAGKLAAGSVHVRLLHPEAGWYLVLDLLVPLDDETFAQDMVEAHNVYAYPGHLFGFEEGCRLVVSLLGPEAEFREGLRRIVARAKEAADG